MEELNRLITKAEGLAADKTMSAEASAAIATATAKAKEITTESAEADIQAATKNLIAAIETAEASIARYDLLTSLINSATSLTTEYMQTETLTTLQNSINAAMLIDGKSTNSEVETAIKNIETATEDAKSCISAYTALKNEIEKIREQVQNLE
jgi:enamine deaminase RidA (YjgF/YER057c/UK114 family)